MDLSNRTAIPARVFVTEMEEDQPRWGYVVAKATYRITPDGPVAERDEPVPLFDTDEETELGLLPRDDLPRMDDEAFEVILLGSARAPGGTPVPALTVALAVGEVEHFVYVWGDRQWLGEGAPDGRTISEPQPFAEMPLTWGRAFGGSTAVLVDVESPVQVSDPRNPDGKGHDPAPGARSLGERLGAPEGFPRWDPVRPLPNLEDPRAPIARWSDAPDPYCWATMPLTSALHARRMLDLPEDLEEGGKPTIAPGSTLRAHPDWVIPLPPREAVVRLRGATNDGHLAFHLPPLRLLVDYVLGERTGTRELRPRMLVLLPDEERFYLVYRLQFTYPYVEEEERAMRLRAEEGWFEPPKEDAP